METPILEPSTTQYTTTFKVQQRNFIGNSGGTNIGEWTFNVDDTNEFIISVWNKAIDVIHRGVMFMTTADGLPDCAWMDEVRPSIEHIDKFLCIYDVAQKRNMLITGVDGNRLRSFRGKDMKLFIYKYSNISSKKDFDLVKAKLLTPETTDRSGAATISVLNQVKEWLKEIYASNLVATSDMCWSIWANDILRQPAHLHQSYMERGPPGNMIHLFRPVSTPAEIRLENMHYASQAGLDMIIALKEQSFNVRRSLADATRLLSDAMARQEVLDISLSMFENQLRAASALTGPPTETSSSREIFNQVSNQEDFEHMDESFMENDSYGRV